MIRSKNIKVFLGLFFLYVIGGADFAYAQYSEKKNEFTGLDRWAFKTNMIDWVGAIPNFSVEYDLSGAENNKMTIGLTARCNWDMSGGRSPYYVFDLMQIRPEYRYYWRETSGTRGPQRDADGKRVKGAKRPFRKWLMEDVFTTVRKNPKVGHVNYIGAYVDAGTYAVKTGEVGHRGQMYTVGFSMGYGKPKYKYKSGVIDMELGFALGLALMADNAFSLDNATNTYVPQSSRSKGLHVAPFPIVSSLNMSFAWRSRSISEKYNFTNADKIRKQNRQTEIENRLYEKQLAREEMEALRLQEKAQKPEKPAKPEKEKKVKPEKPEKEKTVREKRVRPEKPVKEKPVKEKKEKKKPA